MELILLRLVSNTWSSPEFSLILFPHLNIGVPELEMAYNRLIEVLPMGKVTFLFLISIFLQVELNRPQNLLWVLIKSPHAVTKPAFFPSCTTFVYLQWSVKCLSFYCSQWRSSQFSQSGLESYSVNIDLLWEKLNFPGLKPIHPKHPN